MRHRVTVRLCQIAIGVVFLYAALPKIGDLGAFAGQIHNYRLLPVALENLLAMTLPWVELVIGLALILAVRARSGAVLAAGLMSVFLVAIALALVRGLDIECGCFGTGDARQVGLRALAEDVALFAASMVAAGRPR